MYNDLRKVTTCVRRVMEEGGFAIFEATGNHWVQVANWREEDQLYAEAIGNENLEPAYALSRDRMDKLALLGWNAPGPGAPVDSGNYYRVWKAKTDQDRWEIAGQIMRTVTEVYGHSAEDELKITLELDTDESNVRQRERQAAFEAAQRILYSGRDPEHVVRALVEKGVDPRVATEIVEPLAPQVRESLRIERRVESWLMLLGGAAICVFGILVTVGSFLLAAPGGTYIVAWGAILVGGYMMLKGLGKVAVNSIVRPRGRR